jgi:hypothetical protein
MQNNTKTADGGKKNDAPAADAALALSTELFASGFVYIITKNPAESPGASRVAIIVSREG